MTGPHAFAQYPPLSGHQQLPRRRPLVPRVATQTALSRSASLARGMLGSDRSVRWQLTALLERTSASKPSVPPAIAGEPVGMSFHLASTMGGAARVPKAAAQGRATLRGSSSQDRGVFLHRSSQKVDRYAKPLNTAVSKNERTAHENISLRKLSPDLTGNARAKRFVAQSTASDLLTGRQGLHAGSAEILVEQPSNGSRPTNVTCGRTHHFVTSLPAFPLKEGQAPGLNIP